MGAGRNGERAAVEQQRRETYIGGISAATATAAPRRGASGAVQRGVATGGRNCGAERWLPPLCLASVVVGAAPGVCAGATHAGGGGTSLGVGPGVLVPPTGGPYTAVTEFSFIFYL